MSLCEIYAAGMVPNSIGQYHLGLAHTLHNTVGPAWPERTAQLIYRPIGEQILCSAQKRAHSHVSFIHTDQPALSVSASGRRGSPPGSRSHPRSPPPFPPILTSSPGRTSSFYRRIFPDFHSNTSPRSLAPSLSPLCVFVVVVG